MMIRDYTKSMLTSTIIALSFTLVEVAYSIDSETPLHPLDQGNRYFIARDFDKAIANYALAVEADPESSYADTAIFQIGRCFVELGNWVEAESTFLKIPHGFPESPWSDNAILEVARHHRLLMSKDSQERATQLYLQLIQDYGSRELAGTAKLELAECYITLGTFQEAELWLNRVIESTNDPLLAPRAIFVLGQLYANPNYPNRMLPKALDYFKKIIIEYKNFSELPAVYFSIGICYQTMREWRAAISNYQFVVDNHPGSMFAAIAQANLADCYREVRDYQKAAEEYKKLVNKYPIRPSRNDNENTKKFIDALTNASRAKQSQPKILIEADNTSSTLDYMGNVQIEFRDLKIASDRAVLDNQQYVVKISGHVRVVEGARISITADHMVLDMPRYEITARGSAKFIENNEGLHQEAAAIMLKYNFAAHRLDLLELQQPAK